MSRFLDADKVLVFQIYDDETEEIIEKEYTVEDFIDTFAVDGCPQTVDAEPIIRCKDCKYSVDNDYCLFSTADMGEINKMDADDFCSRGERK